MLSLLVAVGFLFAAQPLSEGDIFVSSDCKLPGGLDCNTVVFQLEMDGVALTAGDFDRDECELLKDSLLPGLAVLHRQDEPKCVAYAVKREST
jgi:hypothetical protein